MTINEVINLQPEVINLLKNAKRKNKLVHAYLFEGDSGTGTLEAGKYFAQMLLCENQENDSPCLKCNTCERIEYNSHLNVVIIEAVGEVIRKEQIESLMHDFSFTAMEKGPQIYIIKDADKMNAAAANSLLKFLEEPAPNHYAILTTVNHKKILDTIYSRCQHLHFKPASTNQLMLDLIKEDVDSDLAYITSNITNDLVEARKMVAEGKLNMVLNLAKKVSTARFRKKDPYLEYYLNRNILLDNTDKRWHWIFLDTLILIYKEMLLKENKEPINHFQNQLDNIKEEQLDKQELIKILNILNNYEERLNYNVNIDLLYASLFSSI